MQRLGHLTLESIDTDTIRVILFERDMDTGHTYVADILEMPASKEGSDFIASRLEREALPYTITRIEAAWTADLETAGSVPEKVERLFLAHIHPDSADETWLRFPGDPVDEDFIPF